MMNKTVGMSILGAIALSVATSTAAIAGEIRYRSFSASAAMGPPAEQFAAKLASLTTQALGEGNDVRFIKLNGIPAIPAQFAGDLTAAVGAGEAGGGFDAAYTSGTEINKAWGFIFNSGVPFGPTFDEFLGFLYGKSIDGQKSGLDLIQELLDQKQRNVIAIPIVGGPEQLSGYFYEPMADVKGHRGIGLAGLCQEHWTLRYLPPGENILNIACDELVARRKIHKKNLSFIAAIPGGGSLVDAALAGDLQGFEFATPMDDVSQLFAGENNPGTVGLRYVHAPGWQQQFLITWMLINKNVWNNLGAARQALLKTVARDSLISSYGENIRQQGAALKYILEANKHDGIAENDMVLSQWGKQDLEKLRDATIKFLNARRDDATYSAADRADYAKVLEALRRYVRTNDQYWDNRQVDTSLRFDDWQSQGECWEENCGRCDR